MMIADMHRLRDTHTLLQIRLGGHSQIFIIRISM